MKKLIVFFTVLLTATAFVACSDDPEPFPACGVDEGDSIAVADLITAFSLDETLGLKADDIDTWEGVSFEFDAVEKKFRVVTIEFYSANQKKGLPLPATMANLTHLRELTLVVSSCSKPILDNCIFDLPLEKLYLRGRYLEPGDENYEPDKETGLPFTPMGELSKDVVKLKPTIKELSLILRLGGEIPEEITELDAKIILAGNAFTGKVPLFVRDCKYPLNLATCQFTEMDWQIYSDNIGNIPILCNNYMTRDVPEEVKEKYVDVLRSDYFPQYELPEYTEE
ncbi:MAG: hypothetical protein K2L84_02925 [Muribaculaceae bacterium]|nr:hypothetical protein [Muribaculaceae bacterium]